MSLYSPHTPSLAPADAYPFADDRVHSAVARETVAEPWVLCIHSAGSSSAQFRGLAQQLGTDFKLVAADLFGHGNTPQWTDSRPLTLADEAGPLEALLPDGQAVHLVGHSYGAAVALRIALNQPRRVRSLALYEPAIWGTLAQLCPDDPATHEIMAVREATMHELETGQVELAMARFVDYWNGVGTWVAMPFERQLRLLETARSLRAIWHATFFDRWPAAALHKLDMPALLLGGSASTAAARRVTLLLRGLLPRTRTVEFSGLGHMAPVSNAAVVNQAIEVFLRDAH